MAVKCGNCKKILTDQNRSKGYRSLCKECYSEYMKNYYKRKPEKYKKHKDDYVRLNDNIWILKAQSLVAQRLIYGCMDCKELDPIVLEFDHRDSSTKKFSISSLMKRKVTEAELIEELNKCDVVCANCHRRRTAKQFGSWRQLL